MRRKSLVIGDFKFRRASQPNLLPPREPPSSKQPTPQPSASAPAPQTPSTKRLQSPHPSSTTSLPPPPNPASSTPVSETAIPAVPKRPPNSLSPSTSKRRKKNPPFSPVPQLDPNLPDDHHRLHHLVQLCLGHEFSKKKYASLPPDERLHLDASVKRVLDVFSTLPSTADLPPSDEFRPNPTNAQLKQRESQLAAICQLYERELDQWQQVSRSAEQDPISAIPVPEPEDENVVPPDQQARIDDVLVKSTRAVEAYILHTDHMRTMVKQLEARNKNTTTRVRDIAAKLNHRVQGEFGAVGEQSKGLMPPRGLKNVETDDLNVIAMAGET